jgi:hypothetical protein
MATALQRAGGALNANLHFHTLVLDGVFTAGPEGALTFHPASGPTAAEMAAEAHGRRSVESTDWGRPVGSDDDGPDMARSRP